MALKRHFNDDEKVGLTKEEIKLGERYLRKNKTAGAVPMPEAMTIYENLMLGASITEIHYQNTHWPIGKIVLTIALNRWMAEKQNMLRTIRDQVQAKVAKSIMDSVNFITSMIAVANTEHLYQMHQYIKDPDNHPKPDLRIETLKEYKDMLDSLQRLMAGANSTAKNNAAASLFDAVDRRLEAATGIKNSNKNASDEDDVQALMAELVDE